MLLWAALAALAAGSAGCAQVFLDGEHAEGSMELGPSETGSLGARLEGLGYRQVHMPGFSGQALLVRVEDPGGNLISDGVVRTRLAVDYFEAPAAGPYSVAVTNLSEAPARVELAVGSAEPGRMAWPAGAAGCGAAMAAAWACMRAFRYMTAQPEENTA